MSLVRILLKDINIPATTAMETICPNGRILALQAGANVIMPNVTKFEYKKKYEIYPGKISKDACYDGNLNNQLLLEKKDIEEKIAEAADKQEAKVEEHKEEVQKAIENNVAQYIADKKATALELALFAASCFEAVKLNPVLVLGKNKVGVGVWLYESCFSSTTQDDMSIMEKYVVEGVNNLAVFNLDDVFAHKNASFTTSLGHFLTSVKSGEYEIA